MPDTTRTHPPTAPRSDAPRSDAPTMDAPEMDAPEMDAPKMDARGVVVRYGDLEAAAAQGDDQAVVDKIKQARARRDALMGDAAVSARFPK